MQLSALVEEFLQHYGRALGTGDTDGIAACWEVPALVVADDAVVRVDSVDQIRAFFGRAARIERWA